ncbi:MAG: hypothetical protein Q9219_004657 [cf. Caloplaca sp. 3 TL-2023]
MVYCGKLSKACLPCRRRKVRCDLRQGTCTQCARAQLACTGYRDTTALRLRDETSVVQRRAQEARSTNAVPRQLELSLCNQARDIFYHDYVIGPTKPFEFLRFLHSPTCKDEHLNHSIDAVALAYLNAQRNSASAEREAMQHYSSAIALTRAVVNDPDKVRHDSTILSIMLLDLYEKMTYKEASFRGVTATHLNGALAVVKLRGDEQFSEPTVARMLRRLCSSLVITNVLGHKPIMSDLIALRTSLATHLPSLLDLKWRQADLVVEFASLRENLQRNGLSDVEAIRAFRALDAKFVNAGVEAPPAWQFKTVHVQVKTSHHFQSFHHIHAADNVAHVWHTLRLTRILLNELICSKCLDCQKSHGSDLDMPAIHRSAVSAIKEMATDICASLPPYLSDPRESSPDASSKQETSNAASRPEKQYESSIGQPDLTKRLPVYRFIYPLFVTARSPAVSPSLKKWVIEQLRFIADRYSMENAMAVANILDSGQKVEIWDVYAMLGSYAYIS